MQATDFKTIEQLVKTSGAPYYRLSKKDNAYKAANIIKVNTANENADVQNAWEEIKTMCEMVNEMNPDAIFELELMTSKSANGSGKVGPFSFSLKTEGKETNEPKAPTFTAEKESEVMNRGYKLAEEHSKPLFELMRRENELTMKTLLFESEQKAFAEKMRLENERLAELEKKFNSRKAAGMESLENFATANIPKLLKVMGGGNAANGGLSGAETEEVEEVLTVEEEAINDVATLMHTYYTEDKLNLARIKKLGEIIKGAVERFNAPSTQTNEQ